jgi:hypothetical protein
MPSSTRRPTVLALTLTALAVAALLVAPAPMTETADARAPPQPACAVCTDALDGAAAERDVPVDRGDGSLTVAVHDNGTATWTARVDLHDGVEELRNDSLRTEIVEQVVTGRSDLDVTAIRSRLQGATLVVSYRSRAAVTESAGALVFEGVRASGAPPFAVGGEGTWYVGADSFSIVGPPDHVVRATPSEGTVDTAGGAVHWTGGGRDGDGRTTIDRSLRPAFVPDGATFPGVRAGLARLLSG